jgi:hypothetical protein
MIILHYIKEKLMVTRTIITSVMPADCCRTWLYYHVTNKLQKNKGRKDQNDLVYSLTIAWILLWDFFCYNMHVEREVSHPNTEVRIFLIKGQPGAWSSRFARGPGRGQTTLGHCTQPFLAIFARGCFHDLMMHKTVQGAQIVSHFMFIFSKWKALLN